MSRDSSFTHLHRLKSQHAEWSDDFLRSLHQGQLAPPDLQIPADQQPANPEDEDDVVPDQHAAFGIQRATQRTRDVEWKDLGLEELLGRNAVGASSTTTAGLAGRATAADAAAGRGNGSTAAARAARGEAVRAALQRRQRALVDVAAGAAQERRDGGSVR